LELLPNQEGLEGKKTGCFCRTYTCCAGRKEEEVDTEKKAMILASFDAFLGTVWWSALMVIVGFGAGVYLRPWVAKLFCSSQYKK